MDAWTNTYASLGPRAPGPAAGEFLFCALDYQVRPPNQMPFERSSVIGAMTNP
jgi:hypothetical protein